MIEAVAPIRQVLRNWMRPLVSTPLHPQWLAASSARHRVAWVSARAKGVVLDVGCADKGVGQFLSKDSIYLGLDYLVTAKGLYQTRPDIYGDAARLPIADGLVDTVLLLDVVEHLPEPELAFAEARRVLGESGKLLVTVPYAYPLHDQPYDYQRLTRHGLRFRLERAGFQVLEVQEVSDAIVASASCLALSLAQAAIEALASRSWRIALVPALLGLVPVVNIMARFLACLAPVRGLMPAGYFVLATPAVAQ